MSGSSVTDVRSYRWSSADDADRFSVENPATGEVIAVVQGAGAAEVDAAVEAAHRAFTTDWRWRSADERARLLLACADVLEEHADELAEIEESVRRMETEQKEIDEAYKFWSESSLAELNKKYVYFMLEDGRQGVMPRKQSANLTKAGVRFKLISCTWIYGGKV